MEYAKIGMPGWTIFVLRAAAVYNVTWGTFALLFPNALFESAGMSPLNYPSMLQSLGILVGLFGIGYWIAAWDPVRYWPTIFVGLIGKLIVPFVLLVAWLRGELPPVAVLGSIPNDIAWWIPLGAILLHAARTGEAQEAIKEGAPLADALRAATDSPGRNLLDISFESPLLIVCIRHFGCTYCRETLSDLAGKKDEIQKSGLVPVIVHMGSSGLATTHLNRYGLGDVIEVSDPERRIYRALELPFGTFSQLLSPFILWRALAEGVVFRHGFGRLQENGLQLAGAFIVKNGMVVKSFRSKSAADRINFSSLTTDRSETEEVCAVK